MILLEEAASSAEECSSSHSPQQASHSAELASEESGNLSKYLEGLRWCCLRKPRQVRKMGEPRQVRSRLNAPAATAPSKHLTAPSWLRKSDSVVGGIMQCVCLPYMRASVLQCAYTRVCKRTKPPPVFWAPLALSIPSQAARALPDRSLGPFHCPKGIPWPLQRCLKRTPSGSGSKHTKASCAS